MSKNQKNRKSKPLMFRLEESVIVRMDEICHLSGCSRVALVESLVNSEYDRLSGNPQLKALLEQLKTVSDTIKAMNGAAGSGTQ